MINKSLIFVILLIVFSVFLNACDISNLSSSDIQKISNNIIQCDPPYMRHGAECCLDQNTNKICDSDENQGNQLEKNTDNSGISIVNPDKFHNDSLNEKLDDISDTKNKDDLSNNSIDKGLDNESEYISKIDDNSSSKVDVMELSDKIFSNVDSEIIKNSNSDDIIKANVNQDKDVDSDSDGISDSVELSGELGYVTDPNNADTDGDGLSDLREYWWLCDPTNPDTNGDFISDGDSVNNREAYPYKIDVSKRTSLGTYDVDGDGIPTAAEKFDLGLNYKSYSSDGDRYGDGQEYFGLDSTIFSDTDSLPSYVVADPYNPATPDIAIRVKNDYQLIFDKKVVEGDTTSTTTITQDTTTNTFEQSVVATVGAEASTSVGISSNPFGGDTGAKVEAYVGIESNTGYTFKGERFTSDEDLKKSFVDSETDYSNTKLRIWLKIENIGKDILTSELKEISLNYYLGLDNEPFATQVLDTSLTNLKPGDIVSLSQTDITLSYDEFLRVLKGDGITVNLEHYSFGEDQTYLETAKSSGIRSIVDGENLFDEKFIIPSSNETIKSVLTSFGYNFTFNNNELTEFDEIKKSGVDAPYKSWSIYITRYFGNEIKITEPLENTKLYAGDFLVVKYRLDTDGDGLSDEDEIRLGTDSLKMDTDGDGFTDGYSNDDHVGELTIGTNPLLKDSDFDFIPDNVEVDYGTDPTDSLSYPNVAFLYEFKDFRGNMVEVIDKKDLYTTFNNKASSIIVPKGLAAILYNKDNYEQGNYGDNAIVFGSVNDLTYFDDKTTSIKIVKIEDLPNIKLVGKEGTFKKFDDLFGSVSEAGSNDVCLFLNIDLDKSIETSGYFCQSYTMNGKRYMARVSTGTQKYASYAAWEIELSRDNWLHFKNVKSSRLRDDYDICLLANVDNKRSDEVRGYACNNREFEFYLNWKIVPYSDGWVRLVNEGSSKDRSKDVCLWMDADVDFEDEVQGYNCNSAKVDNIKWRFVLSE